MDGLDATMTLIPMHKDEVRCTTHTVDPVVPTMSVVVVSYNTAAVLRHCLQAIRSVGSEEVAETIVVDNGSHDGSVELVQAEFPEVRIIVNAGNVGFGSASNQGIAAARARYVLLLNSDVLIRPGVPRALASYLERHPTVGIVGPQLVNPDGSLQPSCFPEPTPLHAFLDMAGLIRLIRVIPALRQRYPRTWAHDCPRAVPWVLGAALAIRRTAFDVVGGFDESFFMYFEETDLCRRLRACGWTTHFTPTAAIVHLGGASTAQQRQAMEWQLFTSMARYYRCHYSSARLMVFIAIVWGVGLAKLARDGIRLRRARDVGEQTRLREDIATWHRIVRGGWAVPPAERS